MNLLYARAGGGGSGGGAARGIGTIIGLISVALTFFFINQKNKKAKKEIALSEQEDSFWNYDGMILHTQNTFIKMQEAWSERDMDLVKDIVTENLYTKFKKDLDWMKMKREQNLMEDIDIKKIKIIGDEDYLNNELDRFTAYISGKMVDYKISDKTQEIIFNKSKDSNSFSDLYYFIRHENRWLLDRIDNQVDLFKVLQSKQVIQ
jgi:predicted lipid-binding transport protein (Tim44 family)